MAPLHWITLLHHRLTELSVIPFVVDLGCVDPKDAHQIWPQAGPLIRTAIERTGLSEFQDIENAVFSGDQLLWLAISDHIEAAATTHLIKTSGKPVLVITACSGANRERWLPLFARIEKYGKDEGCKCIRIYGRKGWERVLKNYRVEHVILERAL
jgi:hypothetical protein